MRPLSEPLKWRLKTLICLTWAISIAILYAKMTDSLPAQQLKQFFTYSQEFFLWQTLGTALLGAMAFTFLPAFAGRLLGAYLVISTISILAFSSELILPIAFLFFMLWNVAATNSVRITLKHLVDPAQATWGMAASVMYSTFIPVMFFLCLFKSLTATSVTVIAAAAVLPGVYNFSNNWRRTYRAIIRFWDSLNPVGSAALCSIWTFLALSFVWANTPEAGPDPIRRYVPYIQDMVNNHGFEPRYVFWGDLIPHAVQSIFASGFAVDSLRTGKWISWLPAVILTLLVSEEVTRRSSQINLGILAGAGALACPLFLYLTTTLFIDHVVSLLCVAATVALFRGFQTKSRKGIFLSAFIMGCATQTKYNVLIFCAIWAAAMGAYALNRFGPTRGIRWCITPALMLGVAGSPWYAYTFYVTDNPMYPWFNEWFHSPYWPDQRALDFGFEIYTLGETTFDHIFFPWTITFHSSRIDQSHDGRMGFQLLALTPFILLLTKRHWRRCLDLGIYGLIFFAGICIYVPYARYLLPGYFLMLISLFLSLGTHFDPSRWNLPRWTSAIIFTVIFAMTLLPVPFFTTSSGGLPWQVYTKVTTDRDWLTTRFPGYPAIEQLNSILDKSDFVLVTGYPPVYTVSASAHVFPIWHLDINGVYDYESLSRFFTENNAQYWVLDFSTTETKYFDDLTDADSHYWLDSRLVAASSMVAVFDISKQEKPSQYSLSDSREVPPLLLPRLEMPNKNLGEGGWQHVTTKTPKAARQTETKMIAVPPGVSVEHTFSVEPGERLIRASIHLEGERHSISGRFYFGWYGKDDKLIDDQHGSIYHKWNRVDARFYGNIPQGATWGRLRFRASGKGTLQLGDSRIDSWTSADQDAPEPSETGIRQ